MIEIDPTGPRNRRYQGFSIDGSYSQKFYPVFDEEESRVGKKMNHLQRMQYDPDQRRVVHDIPLFNLQTGRADVVLGIVHADYTISGKNNEISSYDITARPEEDEDTAKALLQIIEGFAKSQGTVAGEILPLMFPTVNVSSEKGMSLFLGSYQRRGDKPKIVTDKIFSITKEGIWFNDVMRQMLNESADPLTPKAAKLNNEYPPFSFEVEITSGEMKIEDELTDDIPYSIRAGVTLSSLNFNDLDQDIRIALADEMSNDSLFSVVRPYATIITGEGVGTKA